MHTALRRAAMAGLTMLMPCATRAIAATPEASLLVLVKVTGAVQHAGGYQHEGDSAHKCMPALEIPPLPTPGSKFGNTPFVVSFDAAARPPGNSFRLELPFVSQGPGVQNVPYFRIAMTAGARFWEGDNTTGAGRFATNDAGITGSFTITGLHSAGSPDTIDVEGTWSCPHLP